ncbi:MAG: magnesium transporter, partial [Promicromonosporaceae bacterium]|nr:magnesium transporter [Promicromonosporaceae bacterium]
MQNIKALVEAHNTVDLKAALAAASELEIRRALHELPPAERGLVFRLLSKDQALEAFEELDADQQEELLKSLTDEQVKLYLETLAPDARVRLLDEVPANVAKRWLASVSPQERELTDRLLGYGSETAGRMMTPEFISLSKAMTADEALAKVRQEAHDTETVYTLYVTDTTKRLEGVLTLRELLVAEPTAKVADVMHTGIVSVGTAEDQEQVARLLQDLDLLALPVVDSEQRIVGIVTVDDAIDVIEEEATDDIYDQAGLVDLTRREESRSEVLLGGSIWSIWKVRLPFLLITVVAGVLAAP